MKYFVALILVAATNLSLAQTGSPTAPGDFSPARQRVAEAQRVIVEKPEQYNAYNILATALIQRARETFDPGYYAQAAEAVQKSLTLSPNNFDTQQIQVSILLGEHEFPAALEAAKALNNQVPDAVMVYGLLTDANMALGNYKDAETSAQWMLDLRPGNLPALIHAAQLRELFGDVDGSYELFDMACQSTPPTETSDRAWLLTQMGHLRLVSGNTSAAEQFARQALAAFPNYAEAIGTLAEIRTVQQRYEEAVALFRQRYDLAPRPQNLYELAEALQFAGHKDDAKKAFTEFESEALAEAGTKDNANRELIFYYSDYAHRHDKALALARQEYSWRQDVYTLDAYAWALHVDGQEAEARKQIETALAVGIRDAQLFRHAGEIALKAGDRASAERYLKDSAELNAAGSGQARDSLAKLSPAGH
jgi:tetratricopeptide (TPR) repeat protein